MDYVSCAPATLYRDGGFFEAPEILARLCDPAQTPQNECRLVGELYPSYGYLRPEPDCYTEDATFRAALDAHCAYVNTMFRHGAASAVVCLASAFLNQNVLYARSEAGLRIVFETHRSVDRPYVPQIDPAAFSSPAQDISDPTVLNLFLGSAGSANYGHWLVDDLPRARAVEALQAEAAGRPVRIWITSASPAMDRVRVASLEQVCNGLGRIQVGLLQPNHVYAFRELYYATPVSRHPALKSPDAITFLRNRVKLSGASAGLRLFVTRRPAHSRGLVNSDAIQRQLEQRGFVALDVERMSFAEQAAVFASADAIVGCMGAAMTNCVFAPGGAATLYLAPAGWTETFYWDLAAICGHRYLACYGPLSDPARPAHLGEYSINPAVLDDLLDKISAFSA